MPEAKEEIRIAIIIATFLFLILTLLITISIILYKSRQNRYKEDTKQLEFNFQQSLLQTQLEIQEQTLKTISQEIHDNIGQVLSLAKLNINTMNCNEPELLQVKIADSKHLISKAINDLRDLSRSLNTDYVHELGLARAVEYELELIKKTGSFETQLSVEGKPFRLEQQQELIIFRIVQEALHNIIRHAHASVIDVQLKFDPGTFMLSINDNGEGFDAIHLKKNNYNSSGLGIRNMYNRAKLINTTFDLCSDLEKGTTLTLSLSLPTNKL